MTTYLLDNNRGNDSNDGITAPWKELTKIATIAAAAGDEFLLADDSHWNYNLSQRIVPPNTWSGTAERPVIIGKYSPSSQALPNQLPIISWNYQIKSSDWIYDGANNGWYYTAPGSVGALCYVKLAGEWGASRIDSGLPLASVYGRYHNSGNNFYLYAPAGIDPTTYYGGVLLSTSAGCFSISTARNYVVIQDIKFVRTGTGILTFSENTSTPTDVIIQRVHAYDVSDVLRGSAGTLAGALRFEAKNCNIENWGAAAITGYTPTGLGVQKWEVHDNYIFDGLYNYSQGAIYCQARSPGIQPKIYKNHIKKVNWGTKDKKNDGGAIYAETGVDNLLVYQNLIEDAYVALQDNSGRKTVWKSNLLINCWSAMQCGDLENNNAGNHTFENNTCIVGNKYLTTVFGTSRTSNGWRMTDDTGTGVTLNIRNNVFYNLLHNDLRAAIIVPQITWTGSIENNAVYGFSAIAEKEFSGGSGANPVPVNTVTDFPRINSLGIIQPGSPLIGAGIHTEYKQDYTGKQFYNPPSIGAYEYERPRIART